MKGRGWLWHTTYSNFLNDVVYKTTHNNHQSVLTLGCWGSLLLGPLLLHIYEICELYIWPKWMHVSIQKWWFLGNSCIPANAWRCPGVRLHWRRDEKVLLCWLHLYWLRTRLLNDILGFSHLLLGWLETSQFIQYSLQSTASPCCLKCMKEFWHLKQQYSVVGIVNTIIFGTAYKMKWKMTISHELGCSTRRLKILRDHNNAVQMGRPIDSNERACFCCSGLIYLSDEQFLHKETNRNFLATKAPMTMPEHVPSLARHSR